VVYWQAKLNYRVVGKRFGALTPRLAEAVAALTQRQIAEFRRSRRLVLQLGEQQVELGPEELQLHSREIEGWLVASDGELTVALDTTLDEELRREGLAREFVNRIQNLRKQSGFAVTDRIHIRVAEAPEPVIAALQALADYVQRETLAESLIFAPCDGGVELELDGYHLRVCLERCETQSSVPLSGDANATAQAESQ
jgi:isoleucyl-tRNA synthetase